MDKYHFISDLRNPQMDVDEKEVLLKIKQAVANELATANNLKRIEIDLLAFQAGLTKEARREIKDLMDEL